MTQLPMGHPMGQPMMPFLQPMMTGMSNPSMVAPNPYGYGYASPLPSDYGLRPPTMFGPYGSNAAPRNSVMTNLGQYADPQNRMSSYSLATSAPVNPFAGGTPGAASGGVSEPLVSSEEESPTDEEVLSVLKRYLAQQDLMSV